VGSCGGRPARRSSSMMRASRRWLLRELELDDACGLALCVLMLEESVEPKCHHTETVACHLQGRYRLVVPGLARETNMQVSVARKSRRTHNENDAVRAHFTLLSRQILDSLDKRIALCATSCHSAPMIDTLRHMVSY
jgi:hypothetical protein